VTKREADPAASVVTLHLLNGTSDGPRVFEASHLNTTCLVSSREDCSRLTSRDEFKRPGVYVLESEPTEQSDNLMRLYIGHASPTSRRADDHLSDDFDWFQLILLTSKDGSVNKAHVQFAETSLIRLAVESDQVDLINKVVPRFPPLHETDDTRARRFLSDVFFYLDLVDPQFAVYLGQFDETDTLGHLFLIGGPAAEAKESPRGFVVFTGSGVEGQVSPRLHENLVALRNRLIRKGVIREVAASLSFVRDAVFTDASVAASVLLGKPANGLDSWQYDHGPTLRDIQAKSRSKGSEPST
jgi:hypothetical protein